MLVEVQGKINADTYITLCEVNLKPRMAQNQPDKVLFQQDLAPSHAANVAKQYLFDSEIEVMSWPSRSPDLSPVKNFWAQLAREVYGQCGQYENTNDLSRAVKKAARNVEITYLRGLVRSVPKLSMKFLEKHGGYTGY